LAILGLDRSGQSIVLSDLRKRTSLYLVEGLR
jgi:hypothetical protein